MTSSAVNNGEESGGDGNAAIIQKTGKTWTWSTLLRDHTRFVTMLPTYLAAYIIPGYALTPKTIESIMVTMNTVNTCPYCTGLHGQLARMAKAEASDGDPAVVFAKAFAINSGRGKDVDASYDTLITSIGSRKKAKSVKALCWALLWGKTTGNSINLARDKILKFNVSSIGLLDLFLLAYYGPLFAVIGILNKILERLPTIPPTASAGLGAVLWLPQAINITPLGVVSLFLRGGVK